MCVKYDFGFSFISLFSNSKYFYIKMKIKKTMIDMPNSENRHFYIMWFVIFVDSFNYDFDLVSSSKARFFVSNRLHHLFPENDVNNSQEVILGRIRMFGNNMGLLSEREQVIGLLERGSAITKYCQKSKPEKKTMLVRR